MSALAERSATETVCPRCGARLAPDQEWCLECGTAVKVRIRQAPDWRVPVAIVAGVVALAVVGLVIALVALSNGANQSVAAGAPAASAPGTAGAPAAPARKATPSPAPTGQSTAPTTTATGLPANPIAAWPPGVTGYTVVLGVIPAKAAAKASAHRLATAGIPVGLLYSSDYSSMRPGDWIVFSGTFPSRTLADTAAKQLQAKGQTGAYAFPVVPAG